MNNRLKVLRAERNWSQADLAEKLEVSRQSVNAIETPVRSADRADLLRQLGLPAT
jgi:DNA-binding XRE family transcriptional regulator